MIPSVNVKIIIYPGFLWNSENVVNLSLVHHAVYLANLPQIIDETLNNY